jgi:hypothetical protein
MLYPHPKLLKLSKWQPRTRRRRSWPYLWTKTVHLQLYLHQITTGISQRQDLNPIPHYLSPIQSPSRLKNKDQICRQRPRQVMTTSFLLLARSGFSIFSSCMRLLGRSYNVECACTVPCLLPTSTEITDHPELFRLRKRELDEDTPVATYSIGASYNELVGHCEQEHEAALDALACMTPSEIAEMQQRIQSAR